MHARSGDTTADEISKPYYTIRTCGFSGSEKYDPANIGTIVFAPEIQSMILKKNNFFYLRLRFV
jgi:hypothetical protein